MKRIKDGVVLNVVLPKLLHTKLLAQSKKTGSSMAEIVRQALFAYYDEKQSSNDKKTDV